MEKQTAKTNKQIQIDFLVHSLDGYTSLEGLGYLSPP